MVTATTLFGDFQRWLWGPGHGARGRGGGQQPLRGGWPRWACPLSPGVAGVAAEEPVPDDRYHAIYFAMLLAGVGFLLPYNSFITDVDYLHHKFPGGPPPTPPSEPPACSAPAAAPRKPRGQDLAPRSLSCSNPGSAMSCRVT